MKRSLFFLLLLVWVCTHGANAQDSLHSVISVREDGEEILSVVVDDSTAPATIFLDERSEPKDSWILSPEGPTGETLLQLDYVRDGGFNLTRYPASEFVLAGTLDVKVGQTLRIHRGEVVTVYFKNKLIKLHFH